MTGSTSQPAADSVTQTPSLWETTTATDYLRMNGVANHPSYDVLIDELARTWGEEQFDLLDCGVMSGLTYERIAAAGLRCNYTGIDIGPSIVEDCRRRHPGTTVEQMSIQDLHYRTDSFDVVYIRHVVEHLPYYETAVREAFRVARDLVVLILFQVPAEPEKLLRRETDSGYIWLNRYAPKPLEDLLDSLSTDVRIVEVSLDGARMNRVYLCRPDPAKGSR